MLLDEQLSMDANARQCAKTCFFHLRWICQLRRHVDYETLYTLVCALVLSRLDYIITVCLQHLQRVKDAVPGCSAIHLLMRMSRHCSSSCTDYQCPVASSTNCAPLCSTCSMAEHQNISQTCAYLAKTVDYGQLHEATSKFVAPISNLPQERFQ